MPTSLDPRTDATRGRQADKAEPDCHTMLLAAATSFTVLPNLSYALNAKLNPAGDMAKNIAIIGMKAG
jgi:hypothetical protein